MLPLAKRLLSRRVAVFVFPDTKRLLRDWDRALKQNREHDEEVAYRKQRDERNARLNNRPDLIITVGN